jgi:hypothetical protein
MGMCIWTGTQPNNFALIRNKRRNHLVLDLANAPRPVPKDRITDVSPLVARDCARKDAKTLMRDLAELERLGLIVQEGGQYRTHTEIVLAYLPPAR